MSNDAVTIPKEKFKILGQYFVAFGEGTKGLRVERRVIDSLWKRFGSGIDTTTWEEHAVHVLELFRGIGRLAAQLATADGSITIRNAHFKRAADKFVKKALANENARGKYCR